jgi:hypothetical protein
MIFLLLTNKHQDNKKITGANNFGYLDISD